MLALPRYLERGFASPQMLPPAIVPLAQDWSHPLSANMGDNVLFRGGSGINYAAPGFGSSITGTVPVGQTARGPGLKTPGSAGNNIVATTYHNQLNTTQFTVSVLFVINSAPPGSTPLIDKGTSGTQRECCIYLSAALDINFAAFGGTGINPAITLGMSLGNVYELTVTRSGTGAGATTFYLNGASKGTATYAGVTGVAGSPSMLLGGDQTGGGGFIAGTYLAWRTWQNRCLSAAEVAFLYNNPFGMLKPATTRLILRTASAVVNRRPFLVYAA